MRWSPNTIKPNPLSFLTLLKRHNLTLFPYYHPCQKSKFSHQFLPQKKKKNSHQVINILHSTRSLKTKKKGESLYSNCVSPFGCGETLVSIFFIYFNFGFCIEFLIELLKMIEALLFFKIELVCGIGLFSWVLFDFWKDWISGRIFAYMLVFWGHLDRFRWL